MGVVEPEGVFALRLAVLRFAAEVNPSSPWLSELSRFDELVFALLTRLDTRSEIETRQLVAWLRELGLLDVSVLASLPVEEGRLTDAEDIQARHVVQTMAEAGLEDEVCQQMLVTLVELARALDRQYEGKLQRYLRHYGERMLAELEETFGFSHIPRDDLLDAFTYWLQNALLMPLSLVDDRLRAFGAARGLSPAQLVASADEIDLNLAWMDDIIDAEMRYSAGDDAPAPRTD